MEKLFQRYRRRKIEFRKNPHHFSSFSVKEEKMDPDERLRSAANDYEDYLTGILGARWALYCLKEICRGVRYLTR